MRKIRLITTIVVIGLLNASVCLGDGNDVDEEKIISKHKARVENAGEEDWKTYAECANALVSKRIQTDEILAWIDKSIEIKETIFNRMTRGDYLVSINRIREGQKEYVRAIVLARKLNRYGDIPQIQWKILISMGVDNYNKFHSINQ